MRERALASDTDRVSPDDDGGVDFTRFGFVQTTRDVVPTGVQQSIEFRSACPASAVVMRKALNESEGS